MKRTLCILRGLSSFTRRRVPLSSSNPIPAPFSLSLSVSQTRFFSSSNTPSQQPHFSDTHDNNKKNDPNDVEDISNEELKRRLAMLQEGDDEAIPSIFEAVLQRYLAGKPIDEDEELMKEILGKGTRPEEGDEDDDGGYSDLDEMSDTDDD